DKDRARKQLRNYLRIFLESPVMGSPDDVRNIPAKLRSIFRSGSDSYILIDPGNKLGKIYSGNPLFDDGFRIPITYNELVELLSPEDGRDSSADALFVIQTAYSNLDFFKYWQTKEDEVSLKMVEAYNKYIDIFSEDNLGVYYGRTFAIHFLQDGGMGVTSYNTIAKRYSDINSYIVEFRPSDPDELRNAIATLLTYQLLFPDTFANIKLRQSKLQFIYSDLFAVRMPEYVQPKLKGTFMWDGRIATLTRQNYETFASGLNIFDHTDQHFFIAFGTSFDEILGVFTNLFRRKIDRTITIADLRD
ncbi:hypothetical protein LCGC14_1885000, partial [marine sediment metagenome]